MTHGGTSFGHWGGANFPNFSPTTTSYDYDAPIGESGNIAFNVGTLAKVAIINTDEGFEDSAIVTETMAERMATNIIVQKDVVLPKETNVYNLITSVFYFRFYNHYFRSHIKYLICRPIFNFSR